MELKKAAMAGTVESSDAQITVEPGTNGIELTVESSVIHQYGRQIKAVVLETLKKLDVTNAKVSVVDKGAEMCIRDRCWTWKMLWQKTRRMLPATPCSMP